MNDGSKTGLVAGAQDFAACTIPLDRQSLPLPGEVHLWFLDLGRLSGSLQTAFGGESAAGGPVSRGQLLIARRFYLRLLLGAYLGLPGKSVKINRRGRGKPVLDSSAHPEALHFSMAKSEDRVLIGISASSHIGVDLEPSQRRARDAMGVAQRYFSPAEASSLSVLDPDQLDRAFLRVWSCKEAVVKASGMGIANQFGRFTVDPVISNPAAMLDFDGGGPGDWSLALVEPSANFLGAVAVEERLSTLRTCRLLPAAPRMD